MIDADIISVCRMCIPKHPPVVSTSPFFIHHHANTKNGKFQSNIYIYTYTYTMGLPSGLFVATCNYELNTPSFLQM